MLRGLLVGLVFSVTCSFASAQSSPCQSMWAENFPCITQWEDEQGQLQTCTQNNIQRNVCYNLSQHESGIRCSFQTKRCCLFAPQPVEYTDASQAGQCTAQGDPGDPPPGGGDSYLRNRCGGLALLRTSNFVIP
jgi:hypothetical protein